MHATSHTIPGVDRIILADTFRERFDNMLLLFRTMGLPKTAILSFLLPEERGNEADILRTRISESLESALAAGEGVMIVTNSIAGVRHGVLNLATSLQEHTGKKARMILTTCRSSREVKRYLRDREGLAELRGRFYHATVSACDEPEELAKLLHIFKGGQRHHSIIPATEAA